MSGLGLVSAVILSSLLGSSVGFAAGLVPGLHMNNIAAGLVAHAALAAALFHPLAAAAGQGMSAVPICCFLSAAMVAHTFSEAVPSTYVGIPSEDVVSVLPAHRLAKAGMGGVAVLSSALGSLHGILFAVLLLCPICFVMSPPVGLYSAIKSVMFIVIALFCALLLLSEGFPDLSLRNNARGAWTRVLAGAAIFTTSGLIGTAVLMTDYSACAVPDFPWIETSFVPLSSLLLPMFAGLFGVPSLLLSLGSEISPTSSLTVPPEDGYSPTARDVAIGLMGGLIVGWMPGMTSGSAATICSPSTSEHRMGSEVNASLRFIWLYSLISSSGMVFALGALFVISRARSGTMEAVKDLLGPASIEGPWTSEPALVLSFLSAMVIAALVSFWVLTRFDGWLVRCRSLLCSKRLAVSALAFVVFLSLWLTGIRGALLMTSCASLGLLPPMLGVRRIQLMGCLLVPVGMLFLGMML